MVGPKSRKQAGGRRQQATISRHPTKGKMLAMRQICMQCALVAPSPLALHFILFVVARFACALLIAIEF